MPTTNKAPSPELIPQRLFSADGRLLGLFSEGCRTAVLYGAPRVLSDEGTDHVVRHAAHVYLLPAPFTGAVELDWVRWHQESAEPDLLEQMLEYGPGAVATFDADGQLLADDASYGPLIAGKRRVGADFNDFLQISWTTPEGETIAPRPAFAGSLDCSGFVRMVFGYRGGLPLSRDPRAGHLPRYSWHMWWNGPGRVVVDVDREGPALERLLPGDLVFFRRPGRSRTHHVGVYLGIDDAGDHRFIHSRTGLDGPTFGDDKHASILNGDGKFARQFCGARRV